MRPFFMSIVSNSDHWMFISSTGGFSAGRKTATMLFFLITQTIKLQNLVNTLVASPFFGKQK